MRRPAPSSRQRAPVAAVHAVPVAPRPDVVAVDGRAHAATHPAVRGHLLRHDEPRLFQLFRARRRLGGRRLQLWLAPLGQVRQGVAPAADALLDGVQLWVPPPHKRLGRLLRHGARALLGLLPLAQPPAPGQLRLAVVLSLLLGSSLLLQVLVPADGPPLLVTEHLGGRGWGEGSKGVSERGWLAQRELAGAWPPPRPPHTATRTVPHRTRPRFVPPSHAPSERPCLSRPRPALQSAARHARACASSPPSARDLGARRAREPRRGRASTGCCCR